MFKRTQGLPSQHQLRGALEYDPETGRLWWKRRGTNASWDTRYAGTEAFTSVWRGYRTGNVLGSRTALAHRLIFKLVHGYEPEQVDHINGDRADNRIANLRPVTNRINRRNSKRPRNNTSGYVGVTFYRATGKWRAQIKVDGKLKVLGLFDTKEDAAVVRKDAERALGFHPNHGRAT